MEKREEPTVVTWSNGALRDFPEPIWWSEAMDRVMEGRGLPRIKLGEEFGPHLEVRTLDQGGCVAMLWHGETFHSEVWLRTEADVLEFLLARAAAWLSLGRSPAISDSLDLMANTILSYARHGQGDHIGEHDGKSSKDA